MLEFCTDLHGSYTGINCTQVQVLQMVWATHAIYNKNPNWEDFRNLYSWGILHLTFH